MNTKPSSPGVPDSPLRAAHGTHTDHGTPRGYSSLTPHLVVDADAVVQKASERGALVREPLSTFVSGDRYASIVDPFGVRWAIMTRVEDLFFEESSRRVAAWAAQQS